MALSLVVALAALDASAWGGEGHSIVGEIAQRRLGPEARAQVEALLGPGHSLASEANWADDVRPSRPETYNWHFVDIPVAEQAYDPAKHCAPSEKGDCIIAALDRARRQLRCGSPDAKREALRFAVHFVGDLHQPFHTIDEQQGGNGIKVEVEMRGLKCPKCTLNRTQSNLHSVWDSALVTNTTWNWGAYVARLESGWLTTAEARDAAAGTPLDWALESHAVGREVWPLLPANNLITDDYYFKVLPVVDRQLGRGGVRLARFLDEAFSPGDCTAQAAK